MDVITYPFLAAYTTALSILYILHCIYFSYSIGVIRTVEKRFGFPSYKTGFLMSATGDVHITISFFLPQAFIDISKYQRKLQG